MLLSGLLLNDPHHPPTRGWLKVQDGRIIDRGDGDPPGGRADLGDDQNIICPGFIDTHVHLPQFTSIGADGLPLLTWLDEVIFPAESGWGDPDVLDREIRAAIRRMLEAGTLGFAGYLTAHPEGVSWFTLNEDVPKPRAIVGQSRMDRAGPDGLVHQTIAPLPPPTERLVFSVNPRFAISCTDCSLQKASIDAAQDQAPIQTHLAETVEECRRVAELFPDAAHYTGVYDDYGLLTDRTLLGHCLHLSDDEWSLIAQRQSVVVHCPAANTFLEAGAFDLHAAHKHNVRLALGSDVAAGPDVAMPRVARAMIEVAKLRRIMGDTDAIVPTPADGWTMITRQNAAALGWDDAGHLDIGAAADILILKPDIPLDAHLIGRLIYTWRNEYITHRIVNGQRIDMAGSA